MPLTVLQLWDNGFGINAAAAVWMALAAVATWLIAFSAYYYALRGARVAVVAPILSTDPLWTALFAWLILGATFGALTLAGMVVAMAGVLLITRWMATDDEAEAGALAGAAARRRAAGLAGGGQRRRRRRPAGSGSSRSPCSRPPAGASVRCSSSRPRRPTASPRRR